MKGIAFAFTAFLAALMLASQPALAWGPGGHEYACPEGYGIDCGIADSSGFKDSYPYGGFNHLCYDNNSRCTPRLLAKYYLKKYYIEGQKDNSLLGAAAHLMQDAECPAHWFPMRDILGNTVVLLGPSWAPGLEGLAEVGIKGGRDWNIALDSQGMAVNRAYLDGIRESVGSFISQEPEESLDEIEAALKGRDLWMFVRGLREVLFVLIPFALLAFAYEAWKRKKQKQRKSCSPDLIIIAAILAALALLVLLGCILY